MGIALRRLLRTLTVATLVAELATAATAQSFPAGGIRGVVSNMSRKPVAKALLTATNTDTGVQTNTRSNAVGAYSIAPLKPGPYNVEVVVTGYRRLLQENVNVAATKTTGLNLKLTPSNMVVIDDSEIAGFDPRIGPMGTPTTPEPPQPIAPAAAVVPLFRDPIHDGAADPVVVYNRARKAWWMLYTNRRADLNENNGVTWVHGTRIGIAESTDGGAHWKYVSEADIPLPQPDYTLWAPEVIDVDGTYHMFLTVVPGTFTDWNHPRHILHLTSKDLLHWKPLENANLESERTIDACIFRLPTGDWRLWYKNEADGSKVYFSDSPDLVHWTPKGIATTNHGEGPVVFQWHGSYWLINDPHAGLAVFRSDDLTTWHQQPDNILREPGTQPTDRAMGSHADVVVDATGRAWLFYFTQQGGENASPNTRGYGRHSVLHVTELHEANGVITTDRNAPAYIHMLPPPKNKKSDGSKIVAAAALAKPPSVPIHVSSGIMVGLLVHRVDPAFPSGARVSGVVILRATISQQGEVEDTTVLTGPEPLRKPVIDAVRQWKYKPYTQQGLPVDVDATIDVIID